MDGYCERHNQPWDIKCVNGGWVCECPKCRAEGLLDTFYDNKTTMKKQQEWMVNNHTENNTLKQMEVYGEKDTYTI